MPSCKQIAGQLLDNANMEVTNWLKVELQGKYAVMASDGWKDNSRNSISGVGLSISGKVRQSSAVMHDETHLLSLEDISH